MTVAVFLEGLPGAGKTSIMVTLAAALGERCLAVPETNPPPTRPDALAGQSAETITRWYLRCELRRDRLAARLKDQPLPRLAVFDRSYLSVLAYCYAASATAGRPLEYEHARRTFDQHIRPRLASDAAIVLITTTIYKSLDRRRDKEDREFEHQWYSRDFLEALHEFYGREAPRLCVGPLRLLDTVAIATDKIHTSVLGAVADGALLRELGGDRLCSPLVPRLHGKQLRHPGVRRYYEKHGGVRTFGQPLGEPVKHCGGTTQFFERHALVLDDTGKIGLLDPAGAAEDWTQS